MPEARALAFVASPKTVGRLPADSLIVPLNPRVRAPLGRTLAKRPEELLGHADVTEIDALVERQSVEIGNRLRKGPLRWHGVDLGDCFLGDLELGLRDSLKTDRVLQRAIERAQPSSLLTDVPTLAGAFPAYPYLSGLGSLLEDRAARDGLAFRSLASRRGDAASPSSSLLAKAYLSVAARRALRRLRDHAALVALGPHPGFYLPIARAAHAEPGQPFVVVTQARQPMRADARSGLSVLVMESFLRAAERADIEGLRAAARDALKAVSLPGSIGNLDHGVGALVAAHLMERFDRELPAVASLGLAFERGLHRARAALAMETESPVARAFVRYARGAGVPVTIVQHGILAGAFSYRRTDADRIAAWGPADADWFRSNAVKGTRAVGTGSPKYDALREPRTPSASVGVPPGRHLVLYASQPFVQDRATASPWDRAGALRMALEAAEHARDLFLLVKWHPSETEEVLPSETAAFARDTRGGEALELIREARAVLAVSSTVAFEAMLLDRPVMFLGPADPTSPFHPPEDGAGRRALDAAQLAQDLGDLVPDGPVRERTLQGQREFLARHYAPIDGNAARRVLRLATEP